MKRHINQSALEWTAKEASQRKIASLRYHTDEQWRRCTNVLFRGNDAMLDRRTVVWLSDKRTIDRGLQRVCQTLTVLRNGVIGPEK